MESGANQREPPLTLSILIVNFRTPELTIQCLESLAPEVAAFPSVRVVLVDNGSGDQSSKLISRAIEENNWHPWVTFRSLPDNSGFAGGNNRALEVAPQSRYVLLLNSDTVVHEGCLQYCCELMDGEPDVGAMSCLLLNGDGSVQNVTRKFPTPLRMLVDGVGLRWHFPRLFAWADVQDLEWDRRTQKRDVDWIGGAFLFTRRDLIDQIGLLDEDFFFYGEDIEFSHRAQRHGFRVLYDPGATTTHFGGASSDPERMEKRARSSHVWKARYLVQRKCFGARAELLLRATDILAWAARVPYRRVRRGREDPSYKVARDVFALLLGRP